MKKIEKIKIGAVEVVLVELSVEECDAIFEGVEAGHEPTTLDWMFAKKYLPQWVMEQIMDTPMAEILSQGPVTLHPSELEAVYQAAVEVNPFLSVALTEMRRAGDVLALLEAQLGSGRQQPGSSPMDVGMSGLGGLGDSWPSWMDGLVEVTKKNNEVQDESTDPSEEEP